MFSMIISKVEKSDLERLQQISRDTFYEAFSGDNTPENMEKYLAEGFSKEKLEQELADPNSTFYFAICDGTPVGYLKLNLEKADEQNSRPSALEIERIYVRKAFQGQNVGRYLMEKALEVGRKIPVAYVWLGVWEHNTKAIHFYRKNGFEVAGSKIFLLGDDPQTDLIMKLHV